VIQRQDLEKLMRPLTEQVILITGATDGLGKAVANSGSSPSN
jgi:NADP-dependent 3-hydroxy acid dehydrogenase YdfG